MVNSRGSPSEDIDEPWIAAASYRSADGCRAADAAQLQCPCEEELHGVPVHLLAEPNASVTEVHFESRGQVLTCHEQRFVAPCVGVHLEQFRA